MGRIRSLILLFGFLSLIASALWGCGNLPPTITSFDLGSNNKATLGSDVTLVPVTPLWTWGGTSMLQVGGSEDATHRVMCMLTDPGSGEMMPYADVEATVTSGSSAITEDLRPIFTDDGLAYIGDFPMSGTNYNLSIKTTPPTITRHEEALTMMNSAEDFSYVFKGGMFSEMEEGGGEEHHSSSLKQASQMGEEEMTAETEDYMIEVEVEAPESAYVWENGQYVEKPPEPDDTFHFEVSLHDHESGIPVPYATVTAHFENYDTGVEADIPLEAILGHGIHYGTNIKLATGGYDVRITVTPPTFLRQDADKDRWGGAVAEFEVELEME